MSEHYDRTAEIRDRIEDAMPEGLAPLDQLHSGRVVRDPTAREARSHHQG